MSETGHSPLRGYVSLYSGSTGFEDSMSYCKLDLQKADPVRYTQAQRPRETRSAQYKADAERESPTGVKEAEKRLADVNSKTVVMPK